MADEKGNQGGFPQNQSSGQDTYSTTGDGHPPRPGERQTQENMAGQGTGQMGGSQQNKGQGATTGGDQEDSGGSQKNSGSR